MRLILVIQQLSERKCFYVSVRFFLSRAKGSSLVVHRNKFNTMICNCSTYSLVENVFTFAHVTCFRFFSFKYLVKNSYKHASKLTVRLAFLQPSTHNNMHKIINHVHNINAPSSSKYNNEECMRNITTAVSQINNNNFISKVSYIIYHISINIIINHHHQNNPPTKEREGTSTNIRLHSPSLLLIFNYYTTHLMIKQFVHVRF